MNKIILLDWDGPVSNSRTWKMPGCVDPVAIQMLNDLTMKGWKTILTSTIRKNFRSADPKGEATEFMKLAGFYVQWYEPIWRTDPDYVSRRHIEVANMIQNDCAFPDDVMFLIVDDELFPRQLTEAARMVQINANANSGIDHLSISYAYQIMAMNTPELEVEFGPNDGDDEDEEEDDE